MQAGTQYQIIGFNQSVTDWSTVALPSDPRHCAVLPRTHNGDGRHAGQRVAEEPSRAACGGCHDNVNFATGENHVNLPQVSDNQCANCHIPQGELEFDASIKGAHTVPTESATRAGHGDRHPEGRQRDGG